MKKINHVPPPSVEVNRQIVYHPPERVGSGAVRIDAFSSGLRLMHLNLQPKKNASFSTETTDYEFGITFKLKGHSSVTASALRDGFSIEAGESGHFFYPGATVMTENLSVAQQVKICIFFDANVLLDFARDDEEAFLPFLQGFKNQIPFADRDRILPRMHLALNQILACPYTGKTRALFMESKTLELMAYKLEQIRSRTRPALRQYGVSPYDIERIRHAAGCLLQDPANPPDITTLAAAAGMSRSKFYRCFKQVLGHSPLDHLRSHRLHLAKHLLTSGKHNVTETAFAVGYNNVSYFITLFTAQFGVTPHKVS